MNSPMIPFYQNKRVLLTGGLGFIGTNLTQLLLQSGATVCLVDNFLPDHGANWFHIEAIRPQVTVHVCDIRDQCAMNELVKGQDIIFNMAAQTSHADSMHDPFLDTDINCRGNLILLEACRHHNPQVKIVYAGTRAYYGAPETLPVNETHAIAPKDIYSMNRFSAEQYHFLYFLHYGLRSTSLRISNIYGPYAQMQHPRYNVMNWFVRLALDNQTISVYGDGHQLRDYVFITDACQALLLAGASEQTNGEAYNVGSGSGVPFIELVKTIVEVAQQGGYEHKEWPTGSQKLDVGDFVMDIKKIQSHLNWKPQTTLKEGLTQTFDFYRQHKHHYW